MEPKYWVVVVDFKYTQTADCDGVLLAEGLQSEQPGQRSFSAWAVNEGSASDSGLDQFKATASSWVNNPLIEGSEVVTVREMTPEEITAMHAVFNK